MDVFELRNRLIADCQSDVTSFMALRDERIKERVETSLREGRLWPEARIGLNPSFESGGTVDELVAEGLLHDRSRAVFRSGKSTSDPVGGPMRLHRHQMDPLDVTGTRPQLEAAVIDLATWINTESKLANAPDGAA